MRNGRFLFAISGAVGLLCSLGSPVLLPYPMLVLAYLRGWRLPFFYCPALRMFVATMISVAVLETGAWLDNCLNNSPEPALFHPQLIPDLIMSFGVYLAWWLVWYMMLRRSQFSVGEVFMVTGIYGVFIEQQGKVFLAGLAAFPLGIWLWLFVAVAYGSTMALAYVLVKDSFSDRPVIISRRVLSYVFIWALLLLGTIVTSVLWGFVLDALDIIPPKKFPMQDNLFW